MSGNGNDAWSLSRDGILWKGVVGGLCPEAVERATRFANELEAAVGPIGFVPGLLLDRIAANCLRQQALPNVHFMSAPDLMFITPESRCVPAIKKNVGSPWFSNLLKYESLLSQGFHRDLILLQALQKVASAASALTPKKPPQSDPGPAGFNVADQAAGSAAKKAVPAVFEAKREPFG